jgi:hypothetical protein
MYGAHAIDDTGRCPCRKEIAMGVEDFIDAEVGVAVAATAALLSPRARKVVRRGAVYGLAGALKASDAVGSAARGVANGLRHDEAPADAGAPATKAAAGRSARPRTSRAAPKTAEGQP